MLHKATCDRVCALDKQDAACGWKTADLRHEHHGKVALTTALGMRFLEVWE
jgi:hypothetical protein